VKAVLLKGPGEVVIDDVPVPEISDDDVLVEVKYCGICGSDIHSVPDCLLFPAGTYLGHEFSGVVAKVGKNVKDWKIGDRVTANPNSSCGECWACQRGWLSQCDHYVEHCMGLSERGAFAKYVSVSTKMKEIYRLPEEVSFEEGSLVEPLACSLHAVRISALRVGEHAMVLGSGMIGLGVIAFLKKAGAGLIIATEINEHRAAVAKKMGADYVFNPLEVPDLKERVLELTGGKGVDVVYDCSGIAAAFRTATTFLRRGGQIIIKGIIPKETPIVPMDFSFNEWNLKGSLCYYADEFPMVIDFLKKKDMPFKELITSKIKLSEINTKGFDVISKPGTSEIKIIVQPDE